jgi:hypothetical protein
MIKRTALALVACASLCLAGCATPYVAPKTPAQAVYKIEGDLTVALRAAGYYKALPSCAPGAVALCSDPAIVKRIQDAAQKAVTAVTGAEAIATDVTKSPSAQRAAVAAAADALATLTALIPPAAAH